MQENRLVGNQAVTFGQLIEYTMTNILLKKLNTKCGGETSPRAFSKKSTFSISLDQQLKFDTVSFYYMSKWRAIKIH